MVTIDPRTTHSICLKEIISGILYIILTAIEEASVRIEKHSKQKKKNIKNYLTPCIVEVYP